MRRIPSPVLTGLSTELKKLPSTTPSLLPLPPWLGIIRQRTCSPTDGSQYIFPAPLPVFNMGSSRLTASSISGKVTRQDILSGFRLETFPILMTLLSIDIKLSVAIQTLPYIHRTRISAPKRVPYLRDDIFPVEMPEVLHCDSQSR